jgi:hypothetical protein
MRRKQLTIDWTKMSDHDNTKHEVTKTKHASK